MGNRKKEKYSNRRDSRYVSRGQIDKLGIGKGIQGGFTGL